MENVAITLPDETSHLKAISGLLDLPATKKGKGINPKGTKPFDLVDNNFDNWNAHTEQKDTNATLARVYKPTTAGHFQNLFGSFGKDLNLLQFETEEQIIAFVRKYGSDYIHKDGRGTFFLFQNPQGERFVADVYWYGGSDELKVGCHRLSRGVVWHASGGDCVVVLQQD